VARANRDGHVWPRSEAKRATFGSEAKRIESKPYESSHDLAATKRYEATSGTKRNDTGHVWRVWVSCFSYGIGPGAPCPEGRRAHERPGPTLNHERERALAHVPQGSHRSFDTHGFTERWSPNTSVHRRYGGALTRHVEERQHRVENRARQEEAYKSNFSRTIKCAVLWCEVRGFGFGYGINFRMRIQFDNSSRIKLKNQNQASGCICRSMHARDLAMPKTSYRFAGFRPVIYMYTRPGPIETCTKNLLGEDWRLTSPPTS
jgi:hypothetical protein